MEIPNWDERFLSEYDPNALADLYARAGLSAVMFSCKNLSGLCFWPTEVGEVHPGVRGRDVIGETVAALEERGIAACAYYSAVYDNWAFEHDPDWRVKPVGGWRPKGSEDDRHSCCCPNSPGYREYLRQQIADLYGRYDFSCAFCDMSFWSHVCGCRHCRDRFRAEAGAEFPEAIDWASPEWCAFQAARERWIEEFQGLITDAMREARPGIAVYHNFAIGPVHWTQTVPFSVTDQSDFLGGDLYGDEIEQLLVTKLMNNLSQSRPVEYMTFASTGTDEHVRLKSANRMRGQVLAAMAESAGFMFIDAIDPVGTINPAHYDRVREVFEPAVPFEPYLGGEPIEDVAVYFSNESKMNFDEDGVALAEIKVDWPGYPHLDALSGACRGLARAQIPFGVITRRQLDELDRYRVVVLPNVARMDEAEVDAFREYVRRGGRLYASVAASLVETRGVRHDDFMLADVFGVQLEREEPSRIVYAKPTAEGWFAPQEYLSANPVNGTLLRLRPESDAKVLATLTLPYAHPDLGDFLDRRWASIHSSPPWEDTDAPVLVEHEFGSGRAVYSAFDIEREAADVNDRLFARLIGDLLGDEWSLQCDAPPQVWVSAFHHAEGNAIRVALLNAPPAVQAAATVRLRPPAGRGFVRVEQVPSGDELSFSTGSDGTIEFRVEQVPELTMLLAHHE